MLADGVRFCFIWGFALFRFYLDRGEIDWRRKVCLEE